VPVRAQHERDLIRGLTADGGVCEPRLRRAVELCPSQRRTLPPKFASFASVVTVDTGAHVVNSCCDLGVSGA